MTAVVEEVQPAAGGQTRPAHFPAFDGLRAIAAVSVLGLHTAWDSGFTERSSLGVYTSRLEIGVAVFFLISGFLLYRPFVASHLSGRPRPDTRRFYERRLLRIIPAYWLALTVMAYGFHWISLGSGWQGPLAHYFFLQIYIPVDSFNGIPQSWSLCTEMSFYLVLPLYALVIGWNRRRRGVQLAWELGGVAVLLAISNLFRWWALNLTLIIVRDGRFVAICSPNCATKPAIQTLLVDWLPSYLDLFGLGMLLAVLSVWFTGRTQPAWLRHPLMPWASWLAAAIAFVWVSHLGIERAPLYFITPETNMERQALYGVFAFFLLLPAVFGPQDRGTIRRFLCSWPMASVGVVSYGIYLWHLDLTDQFMKWAGYPLGPAGYWEAPYWIVFLAVLALAIGFATVSYFVVERPTLTLKDRIGWWRPARSAGPPSVSGDELATERGGS